MGVTTTQTNKPLNPRGNDQSPLAYNRAKLYSGKALDFDGSNDELSLDGFTMSGDTATLSFHLKADDWDANSFIFAAGTPEIVIGSTTGGNNLSFYDSSSWQTFGSISDTTSTNFFSIVFDGTSAIAYMNGVKFGETLTITAIDLSSVTGVKLMAKYTGGAWFFNGAMSGFKIFNTALTAAQVADLYNNPEKVVPTGVDNTALKLWLPMQEGAGTTAYDGSGNGNHGTISGATYTHGIGAPVSQTAVIDWNKLYDFDGTNDGALSSTYVDTTGTKTYKVHFNSHDVTQADQQIFQFWNNTTALGMGGTINFLGSNSAVLGIRGYGSGASFNNTSWSGLTNNTFYELEFTIDWDAESITSATLNGVASDGSVSARLNTSNNGLYLGYRVDTFFLNGVINYFEVVGDEKWTNASGFKSESGSYDMAIAGEQNPSILAPQGLTSGRDITGVNLFENVRKQGALNLDGNSWAEVHDNASVDLTDGLTLEAWVYYDGSGGTDVFIAKWGASGNRSYLTYRVNTKFYFAFTANGSTNIGNNASSANLVSGWNHVCVTYDGSDDVYYLNGSQDSTHSVTGSIYNSTQPIEIGRNESGANYINADIAQPRIYNRALTAEEVARNYDAGKNIYTND